MSGAIVRTFKTTKRAEAVAKKLRALGFRAYVTGGKGLAKGRQVFLRAKGK